MDPGSDCEYVLADYGKIQTAFTYDNSDQTYMKLHNGGAHVDALTGRQVGFTNVFVLESAFAGSSSTVADVTGKTNATGFYVSHGKMQQITWSKGDASDPIKFFDENGQELKVNPGKSYVCFNKAGKTTFSAELPK